MGMNVVTIVIQADSFEYFIQPSKIDYYDDFMSDDESQFFIIFGIHSNLWITLFIRL